MPMPPEPGGVDTAQIVSFSEPLNLKPPDIVMLAGIV